MATDAGFEERDIWERMDGEPLYWFNMFSQYRQLGYTRTMRKFYRIKRGEHGLDEAKSNFATPTKYTEMSRRWDWKARAEAWDDHLRETSDDAAEAIMSEGAAQTYIRVDRLKAVAQKLEDYILDPRNARISPQVVEQYRGVLDDIAKEKGERVKETRLAGARGGAIQMITTEWGRGGSASNAWDAKQLAETIISNALEAEVITDEE